MNKVLLLGYLSNEPETRVFEAKNGGEETMLSRFTIAVSDIRNRNVSYFINCVGWNQVAQYISEKLHKGDFVAIDGRLINRNYINNEGKKVYVTEVSIDSIRNYGSKKNASHDDETLNTNSNVEEEFVTIEKTNDEIDNNSNDWDKDLE